MFTKIPRLCVLLVAALLCFSVVQRAEAQVRTSSGWYHTLAVKSDGTVWAWGTNGNGQIGDGTTTLRTSPVQVSGLTKVVSVSAGDYHSLAVKTDGTVWAWGHNQYGQLGDGTTTQRTTPVQVSGLTGIRTVAGGGYHSLALKSDGTVWAWGANWSGQLGDGLTGNRYTPNQINPAYLSGVTSIAAGGYNSYAVDGWATVWTWGDNAYGQLGTGGQGGYVASPNQIETISDIVAVAAGDVHGMALHANGTASAWGYNAYGAVGDGTTTMRLSPVTVSGLSGATALAGGGFHSVALLSDGTVKAWGNNSNGQLGDGTTTQRTTPVTMSGISGASGVSAGYVHSHVVEACDVNAVGNNSFGQLGDGTMTQRTTPITVPNFQLCQSFFGPVTFFGHEDPQNPGILLDPSYPGGPVFDIAGAIFADTLQVGGPVNITGTVTLSSPLGTASGGTGMNNSSLAPDRFLYTTGSGTFGSAQVTSFARSVLDDTTAGAARNTLGAAGMDNIGTLVADRYLYTTAVGTFGSAEVTSFARSLLDDSSASDARGTLGVAAQADVPMLWKYTIQEQNQNYGNLGNNHSVGSGVTYWTTRNSWLLLDNGPTRRVIEYPRDGSPSRTITLSGFADPEDIHLMTGNRFVIAQEYNAGTTPASVDELVVIDLPTTGNDVNISSAVRRIRFSNLASPTSNNGNKGIEAVAVIGTEFYFACEITNTTPANDWSVWKVTNPTEGEQIQTLPATRAFRLPPITFPRAADISGMAYDGTYLWLLSDLGAQMFKTTLDGRVVDVNALPGFSTGDFWRQPEGIELFTDTDGKVKIVATGEINVTDGGVDFMVLSPPAP